MVSIKETMIGKKVECNKCKDKFIAKKPVDDDVDDLEVEEEDASARKKSKVVGKKSTAVTAKAGPIGKRPKLAVDDDDDDDDRGGRSRKSANGKARKRDDDDDDDDDDGGVATKKKKGGGGSSKLVIGLGLAVVGVLILGVAAFFLMSNPSQKPIVANPNRNKGGIDDGPVDGPPDDKKAPPKKLPEKAPDAVAGALTDSDIAKNTNLLPTDAEHVFHVFFKDLFAAHGTLRNAAFETPGALNDNALRKTLGFSVLAIDDMICAERYTTPSWKYTVIHFKEVINEAELKSTLKLESGGAAIDNQTYYKFAKPHAAFDQLGRFTFGIPNFYRYLDTRGDRPTYLRIHNPQTLIVGDQGPIMALLKAKGQFPMQTVRQPSVPDPKTPMPKGKDGEPMPMPPEQGEQPPPKKRGPGTGPGIGSLTTERDGTEFVVFQPPEKIAQEPQPGDLKDPPTQKEPTAPAGGGARDEMYLTVKPSLKAMLDKMEARGADKDLILFSSATDMDANIVDMKDAGIKDTVVRMPRQFWDVTLLLHEKRPRIRHLGTALVQRDTLKFQLRNDLTCAREMDAVEFKKDMTERTYHQVAKFISQLTKHEVKLAVPPELKDPGVPPPPPPEGQEPKDEKKSNEPTSSQITVNQQATSVEFVLDLLLDNPTLTHAHSITSLTAGALRVEVEAAMIASPRYNLTAAGKALVEKGLPAQQVAPGTYPPGAFPRTSTRLYTDKEPRNRISWMAGLLPYLGQKNLYDRIRFDHSWRDSSNWMAGGATVPQFLDPAYPDFARQTTVGDMPNDFAATHYVGIAGVGLDAASNKPGDPLTQHKRGIFGYEGSATLADVLAGRGTSNTIFMIQVPYDRGSGVGPWIAGGGATVRGVPEKNSIEPFVLGKDRTGKTMGHQGKKGTFALMSDGTVRFIDQNVSDDVFKAMATIGGPAPEGFDLKKDPNTVLIPPPEGKEPAGKAPEKNETPKQTSEPKALPEAKPADKTPEPKPAEKKPQSKPLPVDKKTPEDKMTQEGLNGTWKVIAIEANAKPVAQQAIAKIDLHYIFDGETMTTRRPDRANDVAKIVLDPSSNPKRMTIKHASTPALGAIYRIEGDMLWICMNVDDIRHGEFPKAFASTLNPKTDLLTLKRQ